LVHPSLTTKTIERNIADGFSKPKKKMLYYLKVMHEAGLKDLAEVMKISRMAVHKHLSSLQQRGLVEAVEIRGSVGRPRMIYKLTSQSKTVFPRSYSSVSINILSALRIWILTGRLRN